MTRFLPLSPDLCLGVTFDGQTRPLDPKNPSMDLQTPPRASITYQQATPTAVRIINRLVVKCAEDLVFSAKADRKIEALFKKYAAHRVDSTYVEFPAPGEDAVYQGVSIQTRGRSAHRRGTAINLLATTLNSLAAFSIASSASAAFTVPTGRAWQQPCRRPTTSPPASAVCLVALPYRHGQAIMTSLPIRRGEQHALQARPARHAAGALAGRLGAGGPTKKPASGGNAGQLANSQRGGTDADGG